MPATHWETGTPARGNPEKAMINRTSSGTLRKIST